MNRVFTIGLMMLCMTLGNAHGANPDTKTNPTETPRRLKGPNTLGYHSNLFLVGGVRYGRRIIDDYTEISALAGTSVVTGCGVQAPKCEQGLAVNSGLRRYFTTTPLTGYVGMNVHYLHEGIRFREHRSVMTDFNLGIHWKSVRQYVFGFGYSVFVFDGAKKDFQLKQQGWISVELGKSF